MRVMASHLRSKTAEQEQHLLANVAPAALNEQGPFASAPRTASGRVTRQALYDASIALEHEGDQLVDPEVFNKLLGLPPPSSTTNRGKVKHGVHRNMRGARPKPPLEYNEQQALAAAAGSSSAWYATTLRVLHELRSADPDFRPTSMLDFGAGFGGATQAARQVWPSRLRNVTAVERSPTMLHFSTTHMRQAAAATAAAADSAVTPAAAAAAVGAEEGGSSPMHVSLSSSPYPSHSAQAKGARMAGPRVTWTRGLPRLPGKDGAAVVPPRFQLVVGAYVLSEETLLQERLRLIDQLWGEL
ncbi:hypothetical protein DUNSADRAFT_12950 [Dunaliella salina]|uniref:Uncharacterized protein n=1 Tax=Dunaliella salina TaxID=3046 RepID=A0ABQ7GAE5_DUNSA|nr:hypothetical protein DUNSADRAFT_12950 [Dunaliella salina]|eukprot:KAF5831570.1 hypothetical protein DUNSADRAFT_12950 [Dunaliella salina]